eukprot:scaffold109927_cov30-Tisochrysis_lutea.AAC.1
MHATVLRFGHCAVRYTTSDGTQRVMNILGGKQLSGPDTAMVNFADPSDFLYGTDGFDTYAQQVRRCTTPRGCSQLHLRRLMPLV